MTTKENVRKVLDLLRVVDVELEPPYIFSTYYHKVYLYEIIKIRRKELG